MVNVNRYFTFFVLSLYVILLSGCAISGCGNPINTTDSNNEIGIVQNEQHITVPYKERGPIRQKTRGRPSNLWNKFCQYL
jgi:hypothetical protein